MAAENAGGSRVTTSTTVSSGGNRSSNTAADTYIGSLISLTSKSEIRYEGILYNINTEESSIGLKNVRSFGTEGRKNDGQQIPPSDKVYEYILFRGSDIKDLQVKSSPAAQPPPAPVPNDPAIIQQSHYPRPLTVPSTVPPVGSINPLNDIVSQIPQVGLAGSAFQGNLPLYQPGGSLATWGSPPLPSASTNESGMAMPVYWPSYYGPPNGIPHFNQQPLLRPPPGLPIATSVTQSTQYPNFNAPLPTVVSNLPVPKMATTTGDFLPLAAPPSTAPINLASLSSASALPSTIPPLVPVVSESLTNVISGKTANQQTPPTNSNTTMPIVTPFSTVSDLSPAVTVISGKHNPTSTVSYQASGQVSSTVPTESSSNSLVIPSQLQFGTTVASVSPPVQAVHKDVEVVQVSSSQQTENRPPILPLPVGRPAAKPNGGGFHTRHSYRGRGERGRGTGSSHEMPKFTEDFDFEAMNEKFNKDEVWGYLGGKSNSRHIEGAQVNDVVESQEYGDELGKDNSKSVYNKDDFFDTLSCNTLDNSSAYGRTKFSEQMKLDTETFGEFSRYWGGRGGRGGPPRGGRSRGSYYGRGYSYGYGYNSRGRGRGEHSRAR